VSDFGFWGAARGGAFTVRAEPRVAVVPFGDSVAINCSHSGCSDPNTTLGLETSLTKNATEGGSSWQKFVLVNVSEWNPQPALCYATCGERCTLGVFPPSPGVPERVVLEPVSPAAVGESRNLTCRVAEAAPLANLTVTLRRGGETLCTRNFGAAASSTSVVVRHLLTLEPEDHGQDVTCCFNLSLAPHLSFSNCSAVPIELTGIEPPSYVLLALLLTLLFVAVLGGAGFIYAAHYHAEKCGIYHLLRWQNKDKS
uniref:Intercellular adhesion molecule N-terminal domain-containing protein n=1 Tax=Anas platyrhynchos TaxID=8839 RepID=A0A8B9TI08_ANAPL